MTRYQRWLVGTGAGELWIEVFEWTGERLFGISTAVVGADFVFACEQRGIGEADDVGGVFLVVVDESAVMGVCGVAEMQAEYVGALVGQGEAERVGCRPEGRFRCAVRTVATGLARGVGDDPAQHGVHVQERTSAIGAEDGREGAGDGECAEKVGFEGLSDLGMASVRIRSGTREIPALLITMVVSAAAAAAAAMEVSSVTSSDSATMRGRSSLAGAVRWHRPCGRPIRVPGRRIGSPRPPLAPVTKTAEFTTEIPHGSSFGS